MPANEIMNGTLKEHPWVVDYEEVSLASEHRQLLVRFRLPHLPDFILQEGKYTVREVWIDTVPSRWWFFLPNRWLRDRRIGRSALSAIVEVDDA